MLSVLLIWGIRLRWSRFCALLLAGIYEDHILSVLFISVLYQNSFFIGHGLYFWPHCSRNMAGILGISWKPILFYPLNLHCQEATHLCSSSRIRGWSHDWSSRDFYSFFSKTRGWSYKNFPSALISISGCWRMSFPPSHWSSDERWGGFC